MLAILHLISRGCNEAINKLRGTQKQSNENFSLGSTVQPVVEVNLGVNKKISFGATAGNVSSVNMYVPNGKVWSLRSICVTITTSADVANRYVYWNYIDEEGNKMGEEGSTTAITASQTNKLVMATKGHYTLMTLGDLSCYLSEILLYEGCSIKFAVSQGVAADSYSGKIWLKEYDCK